MVLSITSALLLATPQIDAKRIHAIVESYFQDNKFTGSVLAARDGQVLFERSYGMASLELGVRNTAKTKFLLGSINKQFTAAAILKLAEAGKISLDDSVLKYLPTSPKAWEKITIRHLLHHESGITDLFELKDYDQLKRQTHSDEQIRARFESQPLQFEPGTKHRYSNSGYVVLGQIIAKVSGQSYEDFLKKNLFAPAGMIETGVANSRRIVPNLARGYEVTEHGFGVPSFIDMSIPGGSGSLYSTTRDLLKWETALFSGRILKKESFDQMILPLDGVKPSTSGIGMGLVIGDTYARRMIYFGGGIEGFNSWLAYDPEDKTVIIALSNVNTPWIEDMCGQISKVMRNEKVTLLSERREIKLSESALARFKGIYKVSPDVNMTVGIEGGYLFVQVDGQGRFKLIPESATRFFLKEFDIQVDFVPSSDGRWRINWLQSGSTSVMEPKS